MAIFNPSTAPVPTNPNPPVANYDCTDCDANHRHGDMASDHTFHTGHCVHDNTEDAPTGDLCNGFCRRADH